MKLIEIVGELRAKGMTVTYRKRKDGSIVIKSISGSKFKGRQGNLAARAITGHSLSTRQMSQRQQASNRENFYINDKPKRKRVSGLSKSQREFISKYNRLTKRINEKYKPKKELTGIGAKQARQAISRGKSFADWKRAALAQGKARAIDLPKGAGGVSERLTLAKWIRHNYPKNPKALRVARYIEDHVVSQSFLETLHDLAYRSDKTKLEAARDAAQKEAGDKKVIDIWDVALEEAKKSNKKINEDIEEIRKAFNAL